MARILIVDDCPLQRAISLTVVQALGHAGIVCSDGHAGVEAALRERPDLVLMDVVMPGVDGYAATRILCNHPELRDVPVVLVTGRNQASDSAWGLRQGAAAYLVKPVLPEHLAGVIVQLLGETEAEANADAPRA